MIEFKYRPDVDGLRAVAVVLVLLFHAGLGFSGGFVGVDVFFVISGFLITGLILKEQRAGTFELTNFWVRRVRRILPAVSVMVLATLVGGGVVLLPHDYRELARSAVAQQFMLSNEFFRQHAGYFGGPAELKPLLHTWSLAVEEQFYLLYPFGLVLMRRFPRWVLVSALASAAVISLGLSEWGCRHHPTGAFYLLPTRAWELLLGGLLCFVPSSWRLRSWSANLLGCCGITSILAAGWLFDSRTQFPGMAALVPCAGAAAIILAGSLGQGWVGRALSAGPVVLMGLLSYSLYLWHWPALVFTRYWFGGELSRGMGLLALSASLCLAYLSWRFVETPFRRAPSGSRRLLTFAPAACSMLVLLGLSATIVSAGGFPGRFSDEVLRYAQRPDAGRPVICTLEEVRRGEFPRLGIDNSSTDELDFLVWGDSHARMLGELMDELARKHHLRGAIATRPATVPVPGTWRPEEGRSALAWNQAVLDYVKRHRVPHVILAARWALNIEGNSAEDPHGLIVDANAESVSPIESRDALRRGLRHTIDELSKVGAKVWIMGQVPRQDGSPPMKLCIAARFRRPLPRGVDLRSHLDRQANVMAVFTSLSGAHAILDPKPFCFDSSGVSTIGDRSASFYNDDNHLSAHGAKVLLTGLLGPVFEEISAAKSARNSIATRPAAPSHAQPRGPLSSGSN